METIDARIVEHTPKIEEDKGQGLASKARTAWNRFRLTHNADPKSYLGGYLIWTRGLANGWMILQPRIVNTDRLQDMHPTDLALDVKDRYGYSEASYIVDPELLYIVKANASHGDIAQRVEINELLDTEPLSGVCLVQRFTAAAGADRVRAFLETQIT